ncbi:MAG: 2-oxo acid dehydrogenase subunit E2, partial [Acidobacteriota bacterium]|nr:2-oxo acid dehydrogenase subunit E2 [Acidobacteriota bacterium]
MSATAQELEVTVPDIGDFDDVPVIEILVAVGDTVAVEDALVTLESDKATMDVPSPAAGMVKALHVQVGDKVSEGSLVLSLETAPSPPKAGVPEPIPVAAQEPAAPPPAVAAPAASASPTPAVAAAPSEAGTNGDSPVYASPSVRRIARELGVDLHGLPGSGRKGRLTPEDVRSASAGGPLTTGGVQAVGSLAGLGLAPWPVVDFEKFGPVERVERTRIQKISAPNLARNWVMIPHVTHNDEADITELEAWRKQLNAEFDPARPDGVKFTMVSFLVAASVATLREFPTFNSALDGEQLVLRRYYNIGFAADTPGGLMVPVIKDADRKGLVEIARDLTELSGKAREGKLGPAEM